MHDATFACPDLTTFCRLDERGLEAIGQRLDPDRAVLACRVVEPDQWCRRCGAGTGQSRPPLLSFERSRIGQVGSFSGSASTPQPMTLAGSIRFVVLASMSGSPLRRRWGRAPA